MKYPVLIREDQPNRYTATALSLPDCKAEAATEEEAVARVKEEIAKRTQDGKLVEVEVPSPDSEHVWQQFAGWSADDPTWDEYQAAIAEYRKSVDENQ